MYFLVNYINTLYHCTLCEHQAPATTRDPYPRALAGTGTVGQKNPRGPVILLFRLIFKLFWIHGPGPKYPKSVSNPQKRTTFGQFFRPSTLKSPKFGQTWG